jgi:hypothetical protein
MECLDVFVASPKLSGLTVAEFNPDVGKDTDSLATLLVTRVVGALAAAM